MESPRAPRWAHGPATEELIARHACALEASLAIMNGMEFDTFEGASPIPSFRRASESVKYASEMKDDRACLQALMRAEADVIDMALDLAYKGTYHASDREEMAAMLDMNDEVAARYGLRRKDRRLGTFVDEEGYQLTVRPPKRPRWSDSHLLPQKPCEPSSSPS